MILPLQLAVMYFTVTEYIWQVLSCSEVSVKYLFHTSRPKKQLIIIFTMEGPQTKNPKLKMKKLSESSTHRSQITGMVLLASFCAFIEKLFLELVCLKGTVKLKV